MPRRTFAATQVWAKSHGYWIWVNDHPRKGQAKYEVFRSPVRDNPRRVNSRDTLAAVVDVINRDMPKRALEVRPLCPTCGKPYPPGDTRASISPLPPCFNCYFEPTGGTKEPSLSSQ
jgi:hypothetical protein